MKKFGVFDILGPVMIGPSSSHTAGAARLGKIAGIIAGEGIKKVTFVLHGSFSKTYKGHGTDKALVAGILGMDPWDERLRDALNIALERELEVDFEEGDLGDVHPNTVKFIITRDDGKVVEVTGSSVGGGNIIITNVDGEEVEFTGEYPTIIVKHIDVPGVISNVTAIMYEAQINIAFMKVFRGSKGAQATMIFETDSMVPPHLIQKVNSLGHISSIRVINPIREGV